MTELILGGVILTLIIFIICLLKFISDLTNKVMSRDFSDYARAKILEDEVRQEIELIKKHSIDETERY